MGTMREFTSLYSKKGSISSAQASIINFLAFIYGAQPGTKEGISKKTQIEAYNQLSAKYAGDKTRDHLTDAMQYAASQSQAPPLTARNRLAAVRGFYGFNKIEFSDRQWKQASGKLPKGKGGRTREIEIDVVTVRAVLEHADIRMKTLVTFLCSTGCRINEALSLHIDDVTFDGDKIAKVSIPGHVTKTGEGRYCYCSAEAVRYLKEWLRVNTKMIKEKPDSKKSESEPDSKSESVSLTNREWYMQTATNKGNGLKVSRPAIESDSRLFPFTDHSAIISWNNLTEKAGYGATDRNTKRRTLHIHMFRKLFRSQLAMKCPVDVVEVLMGHQGYLAGSYIRLTKAQIKESYEKGSSVLHIFGDAEVTEIREQLDTTTKDLAATKQGGERTATALSSVVIENTELKSRLDMMSEQLVSMQDAAAGQTSEISELREQTTAISRLVEKLMSEDVKTQKDKAVAHGQTVVESLIGTDKKKGK